MLAPTLSRTSSFFVILLTLAACGEVGENAAPAGPAGPMGSPGESVTVAVEAPGAHCAAGGFALSSASGVAYVCNGGDGADGQDGVDATAPIGAVVAFAGEDAPPGWLLCNGAAISRTTYAALYTAIGSGWGAGDGATTFNLPDLRGRFLRGTDRGAGRDLDAAGRVASAPGGAAGDRVGSLQGDAYRVHSHGYSGAFRNDGGVVGGHIQGGASTSFTVWGYDATTAGNGGSETRPINVSVNYIVKY